MSATITRPTTASSGRRSLHPRRPITIAVLTLLSLFWIYPFLWTLSASLKDGAEIFTAGLNLVPAELRFANYPHAWTEARFGRYMLNTVVVTVGTVLLVVVRCALAGYVIGRHSFLGKRVVVAVLVGTLFVPTGYTIIPVVELANRLGLLNSLVGLIIAMGGSGHVADVLLFAGYFNRLPRELEEAAKLDGASFLQVFWRVMLPLASPVVATVTILTFLGAWNNFFMPLVFTFSRPDLRTLSVGMLAFVGEHETDWPGMAAGATISLIPVTLLFFFAQRYYVEGIAGAIKS